MSMEQEYLRRIADALERIATHLEGEVMIQLRDFAPPGQKASVTVATQHTLASSDAYETAVANLKAMPDDIPPEPVEAEEPVTRAEVVAALNAHGRVHGIPSAKKILAGYGATLDDVPAEKYAELVKMLKVV